MIYFYLVHQAQENPENAIMAISTFQKEAQHPDYKIRGLALRSLGGLRLSQAFQYMVPCVR